jgi:hypothetical protein
MPLVVYFDGRKLSPTVLMFRFVCLLIYLFICLFVYVYNTAQRVTNRSVCVVYMVKLLKSLHLVVSSASDV